MIICPSARGILAKVIASGGGGLATTATIAYAAVSTSQTRNSTAYGSLLSFDITTASISDCVNIVLSACGANDPSAGNTPAFQITVDGVDVGQAGTTAPNGSQTWACNRVASVTGLSVGTHTIAVNWKGANTSTLTIDPTNGVHHCVAAARLAAGSVYTTRGSNTTSTASSPTDSLLSTTYTSTQASSALYIRFSACGVHNDYGLSAKFRIFVDGAGVCGMGATADGSGFAFNAGGVVVVPVTSGAHAVEVKWSGGGSLGSTIAVTPASGQHAALLVDEVNTGSPHVGICTTDVASTVDATSTSITTPAGGSSAVLIEATMAADQSGSASVQAKVTLDGSTVVQSKRDGEHSAGTENLFLTYATTGLSSGSHSAVLNFVDGSGGLNVATHPDYNHANIVVWPVVIQV